MPASREVVAMLSPESRKMAGILLAAFVEEGVLTWPNGYDWDPVALHDEMKQAGWSLADDPNTVVRTVLLTFNLVPFAVFLFLLARLAEHCGWAIEDWG